MAVLNLRDVLAKKGNKKDPIDMTWRKMAYQGKIDEIERVMGDYDKVQGMWKNESCFVLGCSQGLKNAIDDGLRFEMLDDFHTIGCNHLVEDYSNLDYLIFQDKRFMDWTTFDLSKFGGILLTHVKLGMQANNKILNYYTQENEPTENMIDGLFSYMATGLLALNFAIITGANPIYCLGIDNGGIQHDKQGAHYKKDYPHEVRNHPNWPKKYKNSVPDLCKKFAKFSDKIFNIDPLGDIQTFKKISFKDIQVFKNKRRKLLSKKIICHVGTLPFEKMGTITREIFSKTDGKHVYSMLGERLYKADTYILECFKARHKEFRDFKKMKNSKVISLMHSSTPCEPATCSDVVVSLTEYAKYKLLIDKNINSIVIPGALDPMPCNIDYTTKIFGRISRNAPGKFHPSWNGLIQSVLNELPESKCIMAVDNMKNLLLHNRCGYITNIRIHDTRAKKAFFKKISVAVFCHGNFEEIFPLAVLEAMSAGLPIIALRQHSMCEMIGDSQIICDTIDEVKKELIKLLVDPKRKKELGMKAQERANEFSIEKMVEKWNDIL